MYAVLRRYRVDPDSSDEVIRQILEGFAPLIREAQGLLVYNVLDAGGGAIFTISVFEDQAGAEASNRMAAQWMRKNLPTLLLEGADLTLARFEEAIQGPLYGEKLSFVYEQGPHEVEEVEEVRALSHEEAMEYSDNHYYRQLLSAEELRELLGVNATEPSDSHYYRQLLSVEELCEVLGVGKSWVYQRLKSGEIPSIKVGRSFRVSGDDLKVYLKSRRYAPRDDVNDPQARHND